MSVRSLCGGRVWTVGSHNSRVLWVIVGVLFAVAASSSTSVSTSIPSLFDDEFDEWSKLPGNLDKWEKSLETMGN